MSKRTTKAQAKRRRRTLRPLTDQQRVDLALLAMRAYERGLVRAERHEAELVACIEGDHNGRHYCQRNRLDRWEAAELQRINDGRVEPLWSLPESVYEARRLDRYIGLTTRSDS